MWQKLYGEQIDENTRILPSSFHYGWCHFSSLVRLNKIHFNIHRAKVKVPYPVMSLFHLVPLCVHATIGKGQQSY